MTKTYRIEIRHGYSAVDHLAPVGVAGEYPTIAAAREALRNGRKHHSRSKEVRCDIVRDDGRRFDWQ